MTSDRAKEIINNYESKHGKREYNFIIVGNDKDGIYTYYQLQAIIKANELVQEKENNTTSNRRR